MQIVCELGYRYAVLSKQHGSPKVYHILPK